MFADASVPNFALFSCLHSRFSFMLTFISTFAPAVSDELPDELIYCKRAISCKPHHVTSNFLQYNVPLYIQMHPRGPQQAWLVVTFLSAIMLMLLAMPTASLFLMQTGSPASDS
jgi:hypothetical protein